MVHKLGLIFPAEGDILLLLNPAFILALFACDMRGSEGVPCVAVIPVIVCRRTKSFDIFGLGPVYFLERAFARVLIEESQFGPIMVKLVFVGFREIGYFGLIFGESCEAEVPFEGGGLVGGVVGLILFELAVVLAQREVFV